MADSALVDLTDGSTAQGTDIVYAVRDPSGTPLDRKISMANVLAYIVAQANTWTAGQTISGASLTLSGNQSAAAWTTSGIRIKGSAGTLTDTSSSGTVAAAYTNVLGGNTIAASSSTTFTDYYSMFLTEPTAGTNVTLTNKWALGLTGALKASGGATFGGIVNVANGAASAQGLKFASGAGVYSGGANGVSVSNSAGTDLWAMSAASSAVTTQDSYRIGWSSGEGLFRDAADTLALRRTTNAQTFRVYNTYTDGSNYERGALEWSSNVLYLRSQQAGTGTARDLYLGSGRGIQIRADLSGNPIIFGSTSTNFWVIRSDGHMYAATDNTYDIGASGATRPRNVYVASSVTMGGACDIGGAAVLRGGSGSGSRLLWNGLGRIQWASDGVASVMNDGATDFNRLQFGGTTSSFPALKRSSTELQVRLADDSAYAPLSASRLITPRTSELTIASGAITVTAGYHDVDTESDAASDDLDTINGGVAGAILILRANNDSRTVVVKDGTGNIQCGGDMTLDNIQDTITLLYDTVQSAWLEISRSDNGA